LLGQQFFSVQNYSNFIHQNFIPVYAVVEDDFGQTIREKYHINGFPSTLIIQPDGYLYDILTNYKDPETFLGRVKSSLAGENAYASLKQQYDQNPNDLRKIFALANKHFEMWQTDKMAELSKGILERKSEANQIEVSFNDKMINLYEVSKYAVANGIWSEKRSPKGLEAFRAEFTNSVLMDDTYSALSNIYLRLPVSEEGEAFYEDVIEKYSDNPQMLDTVVRYFTKTGEHLKQGESVIKKILKLESEARQYRINAADFYLTYEKGKEALKIYGKKYIRAYLDDPGSLNRYAWFWATRDNNLESALKTIQKAAELDPKDDNLLDTMSMVYWKMKNYKKAIETEERALQMNPDNQGYRDRIEEIKQDMAKNGITQL